MVDLLLLRWGADETELNNDGVSPAGALEHMPAIQDQLKSTRLLLARAPADRAWRRRGWLVMVRSREEKAKGVLRVAIVTARAEVG